MMAAQEPAYRLSQWDDTVEHKEMSQEEMHYQEQNILHSRNPRCIRALSRFLVNERRKSMQAASENALKCFKKELTERKLEEESKTIAEEIGSENMKQCMFCRKYFEYTLPIGTTISVGFRFQCDECARDIFCSTSAVRATQLYWMKF